MAGGYIKHTKVTPGFDLSKSRETIKSTCMLSHHFSHLLNETVISPEENCLGSI